jgi:hypothetical protein
VFFEVSQELPRVESISQLLLQMLIYAADRIAFAVNGRVRLRASAVELAAVPAR